MKKLFYLVILIVWLKPVFSQSNYYPGCDGDLIEHTHYSICYNETYEQVSWVAHEHNKSEVTNNSCDRTVNFRRDNYVEPFSGFYFFHAFEDNIDEQMEREYDLTDWNFRSGKSYSSNKKYYYDKENKINMASKSKLESLPGIGPAIAQRFIDVRPFY